MPHTDDIALAQALGYTVYHYDKGYADDCYYQLWDGNGDPVVTTPTYQEGQRRTEAEAWNDVPRFSESLDAIVPVEEEIERRGLVEQYLNELMAVVAPISGGGHTFLWALMHAAPEQRARAARAALREV